MYGGATGERGIYRVLTTNSENIQISKNSCVGNRTNYQLDSDGTFAPIVEVAGGLGSADGTSPILGRTS